jgi:predicted outer membrane repeat protein
VNRKQRRNQERSKSNSRRAGVAYLAIAGLASGSIGMANPANAVEPLTAIDCPEANAKLLTLTGIGGVLNLNFTSECTLDRNYSFSEPTTINGPANGVLTLVAEDGSLTSFTTGSRLEISNLNFMGERVPEIVPSSISSLTMTPGTVPSFIFGAGGSDLFINNVEFHDTQVGTAAIYVEGNLTVSDSAFRSLTSSSQGPAIFNYGGTTEITNTTFESNITTSGGGAVVAYGPLTIANSTFTSNSSSGEGGAVVAYGPLTVTGSTMNSNTTSNGTGGAIYSTGSLTITDSNFSSNTATSGQGGAVYFDSNLEGALVVTNSTFASNAADLGGAINSFDETNVSNSTFELNTAEAGGAILSEGRSLTVSGSTFFNNIASQVGGAIVYASGNSAHIASVDNSTFVNNAIGLSEGDGAALAFYSEGSVVSNSTFWNNGDENNGSIDAELIHFFGNILANSTPGVEVIGNDRVNNFDGGANLYTDASLSFVSPTTGEGSSRLVSFDDLKLITLSLNQTSPVNTGATNTVALGAGSVARDYYSATSAGIDPTGLNISGRDAISTRLATLDQRGAARLFGARYDVGAYEAGEDPLPPVVVPVVTPVQAPAAIVKATIAKQRVAFAPGSSRLTAASKKTLRTLATEIQAKGLKAVNLEGYTATFTKAAPIGKVFRVSLSKARAIAVEEYLKQQFKKSGYSVTFTKTPKGAANRVKSNKTEKGRIENRRVEIGIN